MMSPILFALAFVLTEDDALCAAECLYVVSLAGNDKNYKSFEEFRQEIGPPQSKSGYSINEVQEIAANLGFVAQAQRIESEHLKHALKEHRVILFLKHGHFVLANSLLGTQLRVFDPSGKKKFLDLSSPENGWDGSCVIIGQTPFQLPNQLKVPWLIGSLFLLGVGILILLRKKMMISRYGALLLGLTCGLGCSNEIRQGDSAKVHQGDANSSGHGSVILNKQHENVGLVDQSDEPLIVEFAFQNKMNQDIEIESVSVSCSCTKAVIQPNIVKRLGVGKVRATLDRSNAGSFSATIRAVFKDLPVPPMVVQATWDVAGPGGELSISPNEFPLMCVLAGDGDEVFVEIKNKKLQFAEAPQLRVLSHNDLILGQARFENHRFYFSVATDRKIQPGFYFGSVNVNSNQTEIEIPWKLEVVSRFSVLPKMVTLSQDRELIQLLIDNRASKEDSGIVLSAVDRNGVSHELAVFDVTHLSDSERVVEAFVDRDWNSEFISVKLSNGETIGEVKVENATQVNNH